jgi:hypothetical protein
LGSKYEYLRSFAENSLKPSKLPLRKHLESPPNIGSNMNLSLINMKRIIQLPAGNGPFAIRSPSRSRIITAFASRCLHTTPPQPATVIGRLTTTGPPPKAPIPSAEFVESRVARRRKQAELLKRGQDLRAVAGGTGGGTAKLKRFWKDVHVKHVDGMGNFPPCTIKFAELSLTWVLFFRRPANTPRQTPPSSPNERYPHNPTPQTSSRIRHSPRMGPLSIRTASSQAPSHPNDLPRFPRSRHHG